MYRISQEVFICISLLKELEKQQKRLLLLSLKRLCIKSQLLFTDALVVVLLAVLLAALLAALLVALLVALLAALLAVLLVVLLAVLAVAAVAAVHLAAHTHGLINHLAAALKGMAVVAK
jgi:Flp pilus assembly protein TadB